jgi:hypothetical protein
MGYVVVPLSMASPATGHRSSPPRHTHVSLMVIAVDLKLAEYEQESPTRGGTAMNDQAWLEGQKNGRNDRFRGTRNEHAWIVLLNEGYSRSYSLGYRHGWTRPNEGPL